MIVDSSALLAVVLNEVDEEALARALLSASTLRMSAANWLETAIVLDRRSPAGATQFEDIVDYLGIEVVPVGIDLARRARQAYRDFGRGNHPAGLNFGDCFAYALAKERGEPLLFKGEDFANTDIEPALRG